MSPALLIGREQEIVIKRGRYSILNKAVILAISQSADWHPTLHLLVNGALRPRPGRLMLMIWIVHVAAHARFHVLKH